MAEAGGEFSCLLVIIQLPGGVIPAVGPLHLRVLLGCGCAGWWMLFFARPAHLQSQGFSPRGLYLVACSLVLALAALVTRSMAPRFTRDSTAVLSRLEMLR